MSDAEEIWKGEGPFCDVDGDSKAAVAGDSLLGPSGSPASDLWFAEVLLRRRGNILKS